ncbi:MAG: hypothetical protein U5N85_20425 [Arcicella sp.]|nr:hypothetical protein [Arcicella sp.]
MLKEIFDELEPSPVGFVHASACIVALQHLSTTLGLAPRNVDADELPTRIGYADFAALFHRIVPL